MKYIFFLILLILSCKDTDSKHNKEKLVLYTSLYKIQSDINHKNAYCYNINVPNDTPECMKDKIKSFLNQKPVQASKIEYEMEKKTVLNPILSIPDVLSYIYNNEKVFSLFSFNSHEIIYNKTCQAICQIYFSPFKESGGCPNFYLNSSQKIVIWEDKRNASGGCK
jgi:hypothetical protein